MRQRLLTPVRFGIRRLEDRRVLDVTASFLVATGQLDVQLGAAGDEATLTTNVGDNHLVITDQDGLSVAIQQIGGGGGSGTVPRGDVMRVNVMGAAGDQQVRFATDLFPANGLTVHESVETTILVKDVQAGLGNIMIASDQILLDSNVRLSGGNLSGGKIDLRGRVDSQTFPRVLELDAGAGTIHFGGNIGSTLPLALLRVLRADTSVTFGGPGAGEPLTEVNTFGPISIGQTAAVGTIQLYGDSSTPLAMSTRGGFLRLNGPVQVAGDVSMTTGTTAGGEIVFTSNSPLNGIAGATPGNLRLNALNSRVQFNANIGETAELGSLTVERADGGVIFGGSNSIIGAPNPITRVAVANGIDLGVGTNRINGRIVLNGGDDLLTIKSSGGDLRFNGPVTLASDVAIETHGGDALFTNAASIDSAPNEHNALAFDLGNGRMFFNEDIGADRPLAGLTVRTGAGVLFGQAATETADGRGPVDLVQLVGPLDLGATAPIGGDGIAFLSGGGGTLVDTTGSIAVRGATETNGEHAIWRAGGSLLVDGTVETEGGRIDWVAGEDVVITDGSIVDSGVGRVDIIAAGDIELGQLISMTIVRLESTAGAIVDGGDLGGANVIAPEARFEARDGIGTTDPLETDVPLLAAQSRAAGGVRLNSQLDGGLGGLLTIGTVERLAGVTNGPLDGDMATHRGGDIEIVNLGSIDVANSVQNNAGGNTTLRADLPAGDILPADLTLDQPVQNRGGDGWLLLQADGDLVINDSLPEFINDDPTRPFPEAEVSVENGGVIRGQAGGDVIVADGSKNYAILRTHAERFPGPSAIPSLPARFLDPATFPAPGDDPQFYVDLEMALADVRNPISPQFTNVDPPLEIEAIDRGGSTIDAQGRAILRVTIGDVEHLERDYALTVDWGDGTVETYGFPGNPTASRGFILASGTRINGRPDATISALLSSGERQADGSTAPGIYFVHHTYTAPPDPDDAAKPIPVRVELRYDPRELQTAAVAALDATLPASASNGLNGVRLFRNTSEEIFIVAETQFRGPGEGSFQFIKVVESEIIPVERRDAPVVAITSSSISSTSEARSQFEAAAPREDQDTVVGYRLYFVLVDEVRDVEFAKRYEVPLDAISDPVGLFTGRYVFPDGVERTFPDGHYRLYLEDLQTERSRLILDIHISEGRAVPPNFREGAIERQPGAPIESNSDESNSDEGGNPNDAAAPAANDDARAAAPPTPDMQVATVRSSREREATVVAATTIVLPTGGARRFELDAALAIGGAVGVAAVRVDANRTPQTPLEAARWLSRAARTTRRLRRAVPTTGG